LTIPKFNAALYAFNMKNRFREFYADKVDVAHTGKSEPEAPEMSDLELARRIAFILARGQRQLEQQRGQPHVQGQNLQEQLRQLSNA
jgi:hypothetical protein